MEKRLSKSQIIDQTGIQATKKTPNYNVAVGTKRAKQSEAKPNIPVKWTNQTKKCTKNKTKKKTTSRISNLNVYTI